MVCSYIIAEHLLKVGRRMFDVGFIGGDMRQVYMAEYLKNLGFRVVTYGLNSSSTILSLPWASSLRELLDSTCYIVGPIPFSRKGNAILCQTPRKDLRTDVLAPMLHHRHHLFGGYIPENLWRCAREKDLFLYDFMKNKSLTIFNSLATAEGAICHAIENSTINLHNSQCLVLGYGVCGKTLSCYLKGCGAHTTVCARREEQRMEACTLGIDAIDYEHLPQFLGTVDFIFNTVPAMVLDGPLLALVKQDVTIIDIASAPGGIDYAQAFHLNLRANLYPGLPGLYSPRESGEKLAEIFLEVSNVKPMEC